jgi:FeoC like transcriptional regulator
MLEQLIKEIREGGTLETGELAVRLGTTTQLIEAMLGHLQRNGLIQSYIHCGDGCQGCNLQDSCKKPNQNEIRLWQSRIES